MTPGTTALSDDLVVRCNHCGATVWNYASLSGNHVLLDDAPGPYVIDGTTAYKGTPTEGYRGHLDYCKPFAALFSRDHVSSDEFLWL
jgi:hypothetical protein